MPKKINRRQTLAGVSSTLLLPVLGCSPASTKRAKSESEIFVHGVASGDPNDSSVVLWTRVTSVDDEATGFYEVARDKYFQDIVCSGPFTTNTGKDHTVKVVAEGLVSGAQYYYRFSHNGANSPIGRTRTLPAGHVDSLGIAVASCSNYPFGYFNAYEAIAKDPTIDVVLHLGDYIYEYGPDGYGAQTGRELGRGHDPAKEIVTLHDYRTRHAQYKSDLDSQKMHAAHPLIAIWDDHEFTNNPWMHGAENHQSAKEGSWEARRKAALQAYFEWMPVRDPELSRNRMKYWRHFRFGDLASLITLETRHTGRTRQIQKSDLDNIHINSGIDDFKKEVLWASERHMLSADMESFLSQSLQECVSRNTRWRIIGNQIPMARTHVPQFNPDHPNFVERKKDLEWNLEWYEKLAKYNLPLFFDTWDGYPLAREKFYQSCAAAGVNDLLVLTGDSHAFWQNQLFDEHGNAMGVEIGTSGITSPGDFIDLGEKGAAYMDQLISEHNPEVDWTSGRHNGYVRIQLAHHGGQVEYVYVTDVLSKDYDVKVLRQVGLINEDETLRYT